MRYWLRELAGWLMVGLGLLVFYACFDWLRGDPAQNRPPRVVESGALTLIGFFLFRGGIHLLKMAVAARVCLEAQARLPRDRTTGANGRPASRPGQRLGQAPGGLTGRRARSS